MLPGILLGVPCRLVREHCLQLPQGGIRRLLYVGTHYSMSISTSYNLLEKLLQQWHSCMSYNSGIGMLEALF